MQAKFFYAGAGTKVPGTEFGLSAGMFKLWLKPVGKSFRGYTTASNQGLRGAAIIESSVVDFVMTDLEADEPFINLHGTTVEVVITPTIFVMNGGVATLHMTLKNNSAGTASVLDVVSDECKGGCVALTDIRFVATLLELPADEMDADQQHIVPW